jgi:glyoxylase-like metal-dependent hydrolase (beta-lactamase superfamily II)
MIQEKNMWDKLKNWWLHQASVKSTATSVLAVVCMSLTLPATAVASTEMLVRPVSDSVWYVEGLSALGSSANQNFISNAAFVVTKDSVVVIDALGSPPLAKQLMEEIRKITPLPVSHVIVTHYHADHIYGLQTFKDAGARIVAHQAAREYLNSDTAQQRLVSSRQEIAPWIDEKTRLVVADEWLTGDAEKIIGNVVFSIKSVGPSHTPEDLVVYLPKAQILFAGDLVFRSRVPFVGQADSRQWIRALDTLLALPTKQIVPGHGPLSKSARDDLQMTRDYLSYLRKTMGKAAKDMEPFDDAYQSADWTRFESLPLFKAANRINAYNTYLLMERQDD